MARLPIWTTNAISGASRRLGHERSGRIAFSAFLALLVGYGVLLAGYTLANFDVVNLYGSSFLDDTFYYFETAKNLAAGKFSTFDGGITRTNGYHPVWPLLVTPFYWEFDAESALFGIKALEIMLVAAGVCLATAAARLARQPWIVLFAALPALYCEPSMLAEDAVVGSWDSGVIGYASDLPVVNLDGLANSYEYLRIGVDPWDLWLNKGGVSRFGATDFVNAIRDTNKATGFEYVGWQITRGAESFRLKLWPNGDRSRRERSWRDIVSPSRNMDGSTNGYAELRLGRLVQVFLPDCEPEQVPEMLTFSWAQGAERRSTGRFWPSPSRTELGYCTALFVLPRGAEKARTIAIEATSVEAFLAGETPVARSAYDVYVVQKKLVLVKDRCTADDADINRYLHVHPMRHRDLPPGPRRFGFENRDDRLASGWRRIGERCVAVVELPAYEIDRLGTGELEGGRIKWHVEVVLAAIDDFLAGADLLVRADYDIHLNRKRNVLAYVKSPCSPPATAGVVFLHIHPERAADLPAPRQQYGFDNYDFHLWQAARLGDGRCWALVPLPNYEISRLNTGQIVDGELVWQVGIDLAER